ncbi:hypothetical protein C0Q70_06184 [Pomacea canaliculata]|uniref:Uncharacterized protein n=1 Tax=Pomacea canaliculata TaxID=400727 RepID=A0A2T7PNA8_POMCA|nr:hypothetical protein C0Q70_06184 [Pomacea canaliculata]
MYSLYPVQEGGEEIIQTHALGSKARDAGEKGEYACAVRPLQGHKGLSSSSSSIISSGVVRGRE